MDDQLISTQIACASTAKFQKKHTEVSQSSPDVQVTEATCFRNPFSEINTANRAKAAQTLRAIAHLLMSGTLGLVLTFSTVIGCQSSSPAHEGRSEEIL